MKDLYTQFTYFVGVLWPSGLHFELYCEFKSWLGSEKWRAVTELANIYLAYVSAIQYNTIQYNTITNLYSAAIQPVQDYEKDSVNKEWF